MRNKAFRVHFLAHALAHATFVPRLYCYHKYSVSGRAPPTRRALPTFVNRRDNRAHYRIAFNPHKKANRAANALSMHYWRH